MTDDTLDIAYKVCLQQACSHYENFPVVSRILSRPLRYATAAIYSFARRADDIADEGNLLAAARHKQLDCFSEHLKKIKKGIIPNDETFIALADVIKKYHIPIEVLERLLTAFRMDVDKNRYASFEEVLQYCHCSADPVGELVLRLHGMKTEENIHLSNRICTALQLINFIQDIDEDLQKRNRIYIPLDEMTSYDVTEEMLLEHKKNSSLNKLVAFQLARVKSMLLEGSPLIDSLKGRLYWVIKLTLVSALRITTKLEKRKDIYQRPTLTLYDWLVILLKSLYFRPVKRHVRITSTNQTS